MREKQTKFEHKHDRENLYLCEKIQEMSKCQGSTKKNSKFYDFVTKPFSAQFNVKQKTKYGRE